MRWGSAASEATTSCSVRRQNTEIRQSGGRSTDVPLTGDWDGNGLSEIGLYRPSTRQFYLRKPNGALDESWSAGGYGQQPVSGDWNKDGRSDIGTFNVTTGTWSLRVPEWERVHDQAVRLRQGR